MSFSWMIRGRLLAIFLMFISLTILTDRVLADDPPATSRSSSPSQGLSLQGQSGQLSPGSDDVPLVIPPPIPQIPITTNQNFLPAQGRGILPAFNGDGFFVFLPVSEDRSEAAVDVFALTIVPVLKAIGFKSTSSGGDFTAGEIGIRKPRGDGMPLGQPDLRGLAEIACHEFEPRTGNDRGQLARLTNPAEVQANPLGSAAVLCKYLQMAEDQQSLQNAEHDHQGLLDVVDKTILAHEGMSYRQYVGDIQRQGIRYFFPFEFTGPDRKPILIDHVGVHAFRWKNETISSVTGRALSFPLQITNSIQFKPNQAVILARKRLAGIKGICCVESAKTPVDLVLLPYGGSKHGPALRYAYRFVVTASYKNLRGPMYVWLDAATGKILELRPLFGRASVSVEGPEFVRDPGTLPTMGTRTFEVDLANSNGELILKRTGQFDQLDYAGGGNVELKVKDPGEFKSLALAPASTPGVTSLQNVACRSGTNKAFEQVDLMATLTKYSRLSTFAGLLTSFPSAEAKVKYGAPMGTKDSYIAACDATFGSEFLFGSCGGYESLDCPDSADPASQKLSYVHDHTIVAHEVGHAFMLIQYYLPGLRSSGWCTNGPRVGEGPAVCPVPPVGSNWFHDFADAWAHAFENTNCVGGWVAKNKGGVNNGLNCEKYHDEGGGLPRKSEVAWEFDPSPPQPGDYFPKHRELSKGDYADGQIAAAALWAVRQGMRSKCLPSGTPQYLVRFARALATTGWLDITIQYSDQDIYRGLLDLEVKLAYQWATSGSPGGPPAFRHNGAHTINKVTAGFAKAGVFIIPPVCLDGNLTTHDALYCSTTDLAADAVIDIDDNDTSDDVTIDGIIHPEWDYLKNSSPAPTFHVWTGPRYTFDGAGTAVYPAQALCNEKYLVEVASDGGFATILASSGWSTVNRSSSNPATATAPQCHATWPMLPSEWDAVVNALRLAGTDKLYYRVTTQDAVGQNKRTSLRPGNGLFMDMPAPYAIVSDTGRADHDLSGFLLRLSRPSDTSPPPVPLGIRVE